VEYGLEINLGSISKKGWEEKGGVKSLFLNLSEIPGSPIKKLALFYQHGA
jgi:hypothetical protein